MAAVADRSVTMDLPGICSADETIVRMREPLGGDDGKAASSHHRFRDAPQLESQRLPTVEESILNRLLSAVYSGPTLTDIENALSTNLKRSDAAVKDPLDYSGPSFSFSRGLGFSCSRMQDNKYTTKIKSSGAASGGMTDDGYKWRKYGQKSIKNSPYPRSYYRCTNPRCNAKKQVERSADDPEMYLVTYEGLHLHYAYPQLFVSGLTTQTTTGTMFNPVPTLMQKRPKLVDEETPRLPQGQQLSHGASKPQASSSATLQNPDAVSWSLRTPPNEHEDRPPRDTTAPRQQQQQQQGLLEDIVPLLVRKPASTSSTSTVVDSNNNNQFLSSHPSPPLNPHLISSPSSSSSTSSSLSWSPMPFAASSYLDVGGILSSAAF